LEQLSKNNTVINIKRINYTGNVMYKGIDYRFPVIGKRDTLFPFKLNNYIKNLKPDIVIVQGLHVPIQTILLRIALGKKVKIIVQNHAEKPFTGPKKHLQKLADRCVDAYLFASHELGGEWVKNGNISSARKIYEVMEVSSVFSPMDKSKARAKTRITGSPAFLWVGRLDENKNPLMVVLAFLQYVQFNPSARLYMIYHIEELLEVVQEILKLSPNGKSVSLVGKIPHSELQYWFNSADIIVSGSYYEGSGTAVCEAMSCGCMPIVTDIASFRMITDNGKCGLLYEPGNEKELLLALTQTMKTDITEKQKLSLEYFRSDLSFEAIAKRIQEIADSL
jgi:glycosyltransferase involved in cell wall biosynthesis